MQRFFGKIRWRREPVKRVIEDGMLTKKRYTNDNYELYDGMHEPIITQEMWDKVKEKQKKQGTSLDPCYKGTEKSVCHNPCM